MNDKKKIGEIKKIFDELEEGKLIPILEEIKKIVERYDTSGPQYLIDRIRETSETIRGTLEDKKKIEEVLQEIDNFMKWHGTEKYKQSDMKYPLKDIVKTLET